MTLHRPLGAPYPKIGDKFCQQRLAAAIGS
jgi:hypothetical protein